MSNLIDFFDKLRFWGEHRNSILQAIRFYGCWNVAISTIANITLPIYFKLTANFSKNRLNPTDKTNTIVSLTSFGPRLEKIWLGIESLLRQEVKPDRIILYLTASQVSDIESLPKSLLKLRNRGLEIVLCPDNIRSHTKYYYAMTHYHVWQ